MEGESWRITEGLSTDERNHLYEIFGAEPVNHVKERIQNARKKIMKKEDHESVLCVSHGSVVSYFLYDVDLESGVQRLKKCHILEFEYDGKLHFVNSYYPGIGWLI